MDTKSLSRFEIKDADKGQVVAVFSAFDVIDHDGDVTLPGAFEDGAKTRISAYNHTSWGGAMPVGKGVIRTTDTEAQLHGQFFMDTQHGADTFATVKAMSEDGLQEWSYGYDTAKYSFGEHGDPPKRVRFLEKQIVHEVSPVLLGAGIGTRTLSTKGADNQTFAGEATAVLAAITALADRAADVMAKRREKGKGLGAESADLIAQVEAELKRFADLLADPEPDDEALKELVARERDLFWLRDVARKHAA